MKFLLKNGKIILIVLIILVAYGIIMYIKRIKKEDFTTIDYKKKFDEALEKYYNEIPYGGREETKLILRNRTKDKLNLLKLSDKQKYIFINDADIKFKHILKTEHITDENEHTEIIMTKYGLIRNILYMLIDFPKYKILREENRVDDIFKLLKMFNIYKLNNDVNSFFNLNDKYYTKGTHSTLGKYRYQNPIIVYMVVNKEHELSDVLNLNIDESDTEKLIKEEEAQLKSEKAEADKKAAEEAQKKAEEAQRKAEQEKINKLLEKQKEEEEAKKAKEEADRLKAEKEKAEREAKEKAFSDKTTEAEKLEAQRKAEEAQKKAEEAQKKADEAKKALEKDKPPKQNLDNVKCDWNPLGDTPFQCINDCIKSGESYGCNEKDCIKSCQGCKKPENCKWLYKTNFSEAKRKQPKVGLDVEKCMFAPYGESIDQCIYECSQSMDKVDYGGSKCDRVACADLCYKCDDADWCSWKTMKFGPPDATILFGNNTGEDQFTLYWDNIDNANYYIVVSYERNNPDKTINIEKIFNKEPNVVTGKMEYKVTDIKNNIHYNFYILCINDHGLSLPSNEITLKISTSITSMLSSNPEQGDNTQTTQQTQDKLCKLQSEQQKVSLSNTALDLFKGQKFNLNLR